jgi:hypothetical protein
MASAGSLHPQVDVNCNADLQKKIKSGQYWPTPNDRKLDGWECISDIWERPPVDYLHIFVNMKPAGVHDSTRGSECFIRLFALTQDI